ncbi:MAG: hypothetical protein IPP90_20100 [Gemmatimonadaceae bacterium]|nr:hypothetical protein [Gemmatimonadaceae bacterium]
MFDQAKAALPVIACALSFAASRCPAQAPLRDHAGRWRYGGEVGGVLGGTWLSGPSSPSVVTGTGASLSVDVQRSASARVNAGGALRVMAQPVRLREARTQWDGGTLTVAQAMAIVDVAMHRGHRADAHVELGGGLSLLSGARSVYPFSSAARVTPTTEVGILLERVTHGDAALSRWPLGLSVRYSVARVAPGSSPTTAIDGTRASAGWVGRTTIGLRVKR